MNLNVFCQYALNKGFLQAYLSLQCIISIFWFYAVEAINSSKETDCGNTNLNGFKGTITSPNYPSIYPKEIHCEWKIHSPENSIVKINIVDLDIEEDHPCNKPPCCSSQWLLVPKEKGEEFICGKNSSTKTISLSKPITSIKYFSSSRTRGRGFEIIYSIHPKHCESEEVQCNNGKCISNETLCNGRDDCGDGSDELNCPNSAHSSKYEFFPSKILGSSSSLIAAYKICSDGKKQCELNPDHCYSTLEECNNVFDCPNGEDEVGCAQECPNQIACFSRDGCYHPTQRCNFKRNCRDNSDETGCPPEPCIALQFTCLNGACIPGSAICNGDDDCGDFSDEENCTKSSFMTAAIMGLLSCIFLFCIGLSCLYRIYAAKLRASTGFAHQLEHEPMDDEFIYREPPPAYSVAIGDVGVIPYPAPEFVNRYLEPDHAPRLHRTHNSRNNRRRHRSGGGLEQISTPRSRPRPSGGITAVGNSSINQFSDPQFLPKPINCNKIETLNRDNFEGVIELLGFPEVPAVPENAVPFHTESPCSSPSLSPSRESVTSSTSLDEHEELVRSCQS